MGTGGRVRGQQTRGREPVGSKILVGATFLLPSVVFSNVLFFTWLGNPDRYYRGGFPLWSSVLLMPPLYLQAWSRLRWAARTGAESQPRAGPGAG